MGDIIRRLSPSELEYIVYGAAFLGSGGGGSIVEGLARIEEIRALKKEVTLVDLNEVDDEALAVVSAGMGSPLAAKYGRGNEHIPALDLLEKYLGSEVKYVIPIEIGAGNISRPIHAAALRNKLLVDADGAGRAIPELELTTFSIHGVPISPMSISNWRGDGAILFTEDPLMAEKMARHITIAFDGVAGIALYLMNGQQLKNVAVPGSISLSYKVGTLLKRARDENLDVVELLIKELNGYLLGKGRIIRRHIETKGGFDYGVMEVEGKEGILKVYIKNENILAERNGKIVAMAPDLICWITMEAKPLTNADIEEGIDVAVIGLKAHERLRHPQALQAFQRLYKELGFHVEYKPIEELNP